MYPIIEEFVKKKFESFLVKFSGHYQNSRSIDELSLDHWYEELRYVYCLAKNKAEEQQVPLIFLGYSLGALVGAYLIVKSEGLHSFSKQILLAPATATRRTSSWIKSTFIFPDSWKIPSFSPDGYRMNKSLPIKAYKILFHYQQFIISSGFKYVNIPTLIFIDPKDELISIGRLKEYIRRFDLSEYQIVKLLSHMKDRQAKIHHLIVDDATMGKENWDRFLEKVYEFI